jgi:hypothetical protein
LRSLRYLWFSETRQSELWPWLTTKNAKNAKRGLESSGSLFVLFAFFAVHPKRARIRGNFSHYATTSQRERTGAAWSFGTNCTVSRARMRGNFSHYATASQRERTGAAWGFGTNCTVSLARMRGVFHIMQRHPRGSARTRRGVSGRIAPFRGRARRAIFHIMQRHLRGSAWTRRGVSRRIAPIARFQREWEDAGRSFGNECAFWRTTSGTYSGLDCDRPVSRESQAVQAVHSRSHGARGNHRRASIGEVHRAMLPQVSEFRVPYAKVL